MRAAVSAATLSASAFTVSAEKSVSILQSMQNDHTPGMVLTFRTVESALVGSKVDTGGMNIGSLFPYFSVKSLRSSCISSAPAAKALTPFWGVDAWTDFPMTSNFSQRTFFSLTSIMLPLGLPQSGTRKMSSGEK